MEGSCTPGPAFSALRQRLKLDNRTKLEMLAAAVDLALDPKLLPTKACADRKLPAGSHSRAKALADRIVGNGLLNLCKPDPQDAPAPPLINSGLSDSLLVQPCWIAEHAPGLSFWHCCSAPLPSLPPSRTCLQMSAERICPKSARSELFACARSYPSPFRAGARFTALILRVEQCTMEEHNPTVRTG